MRGRLRAGGQTVSFFAFQDIITSVIGIVLFISLLLILFAGLDQEGRQSLEVLSEASPAEIAELDQLLSKIDELKTSLDSLITTGEDGIEGRIDSLEKQIAIIESEIGRVRSNSPSLSGDVAGVKTEINRFMKDVEAKREALVALRQETDSAELELRLLFTKIEKIEATLLMEEKKKNDIWLIPDKSDTSKRPVLVVVTPGRFVAKSMAADWSEGGETSGADLRKLLAEFDPVDYYVVLYFRPSSFSQLESVIDLVRTLKFEVGYDPVGEDQEVSFKPRAL